MPLCQPVDGDSWRELCHSRVTQLLDNSGIPYVEIWDYNMASSTVSMLLTENRKARYYLLLGYLAVYHYTDDTLTYIDRFSSFRLNPSIDKLEPFTPLVDQVNDLVLKTRGDFFYKFLNINVEDRETHKPRTLFIHTLPPYTEDDSDQIIKQDGISEFSINNPIQFADYLNFVVEYKGEKYIARSKTYRLTYPLTITSVTDTQTRRAHYVQTVIYRFDQIDYKVPGLAFINKRTGKDRRKNTYNFEFLQKKRIRSSFIIDDADRTEETSQKVS